MSGISQRHDQKRREARSRTLTRAAWFFGGTAIVLFVAYLALGHLLAPPPLAPFVSDFLEQWNQSPRDVAEGAVGDRRWLQLEEELRTALGTDQPKLGPPDLSDAIDERDALIRLSTFLKNWHMRVPALVEFPIAGLEPARIAVRLRSSRRTWEVRSIALRTGS